MNKIADAKEEKEQKAKSLAAEKEKLVELIAEIGGLWDISTIDKNLETFASVQDKRSALKIQIHFRQKVLNIKCDRILFFMSSGGKVKPFQELVENLKAICNWLNVTNKPSNVSPEKYFSKAIELTDGQLDSEKLRLKAEALRFCNSKIKSLLVERLLNDLPKLLSLLLLKNRNRWQILIDCLLYPLQRI